MTTQPTASPPRRWLSFTLRGAFIALTVVCVCVAVVAVQMKRAGKQKEAVGKVEKLGGPMHFEDQTNVPQWLRTAIGEEYFRKVGSVDFSFGGRGKATDDDLAVFETLTDVTVLELGRNPGITDAGLAHLAGLSKLQTLYLYRCSVTGPGLQHLPPGLEALSLTATPVTDEGLVHLKQLPKLKWLQLGHTAITDQGLADLAAVPTLEELQLQHTDITDAGLEHLKPLQSLKKLSLHFTNVTGRGVAGLQQALPNCRIGPSPEQLDAVPTNVELWPEDHHPAKAEILAKLQELKGRADLDKSDPDQPIISLTLMNSTISDESLLRLLAELPDLQQLNLREVLVGDRLAAGLPRLSKLSFLSLGQSRITDQGLVAIGQITTLRELDLGETQITDAGLPHLTALTNLTALHASETRTTYPGRSQLRQALPRCSIQD